MTVNTVTGEIVEPGTALAPIDRTAVSVVTTLENAKRWLSTAVEMTGPEEIAAAKAHIRTAETYARELNLSKEIQLDAQEMVRRAEYALGKAIRKGQEEGTVARIGENPGPKADYRRGNQTVHVTPGLPVEKKVYPRDLLQGGQLMTDTYTMADGVEQEEFDAALNEAKAEGNLTRRNVIRKVAARKKSKESPTSRDERAELIAELAAQGYSSRQMPSKVGVAEETVRQIARDFDIEIPADRSVSRTRRINSTQVVVNTATALEGLVSGVELIDYDALDIAEVSQWATSLTDSMRVLNRFVKQIKEMAQ